MIFTIMSLVYVQIPHGISLTLSSCVNNDMCNSKLLSALNHVQIGLGIVLVFLCVTILPLSLNRIKLSQMFSSDSNT